MSSVKFWQKEATRWSRKHGGLDIRRWGFGIIKDYAVLLACWVEGIPVEDRDGSERKGHD